MKVMDTVVAVWNIFLFLIVLFLCRNTIVLGVMILVLRVPVV